MAGTEHAFAHGCRGLTHHTRLSVESANLPVTDIAKPKETDLAHGTDECP